MYTITREMVAKIVANLAMEGRIEKATEAMDYIPAVCYSMTFDSGTDAAAFVSAELWNSGLVK